LLGQPDRVRRCCQAGGGEPGKTLQQGPPAAARQRVPLCFAQKRGLQAVGHNQPRAEGQQIERKAEVHGEE
jgi:hypothetical protein